MTHGRRRNSDCPKTCKVRTGLRIIYRPTLSGRVRKDESSITRRKGGTGLGLTISKRIIEMHGGRNWVDALVGQGSPFSVTLPVCVEQPVEA